MEIQVRFAKSTGAVKPLNGICCAPYGIGCGSCGFYPVTRPNMPPTHQAFLPYFTDFLADVREFELTLPANTAALLTFAAPMAGED